MRADIEMVPRTNEMEEVGDVQNRRAKRSLVLLAAKVRTAEGVHEVKLRNLSQSGALLESGTVLAPGDHRHRDDGLHEPAAFPALGAGIRMPFRDEPIVTLATFETEFEASLARGALEAIGIRAMVPGEQYGTYSRGRGRPEPA